ncbi:MAG: hypothetical protein STSR0006_14530 [Lentimicrobium sp.]
MKAVSSGTVTLQMQRIEPHFNNWWGIYEFYYPCFNYYLWGPYDAPDPPCVAGLTIEKRMACKNDYCPTYDTIHYDSLSFYAESGKFYYLLIFLQGVYSFDTVYSTIWQINSGEPEAGILTCEGITDCAVFAITTNTGVCNPSTNMFTLSGKIFFYNPPQTGSLLIWDNNTGYAVLYNAPFTSPIQYSIPGIPCDNTQHTITAMFTEENNCTLSTSYLAPVLCPDAVLTGGGQVCEGDTVYMQILLSSYVQTPVNFSINIDGQAQQLITTSGPFPYTFPALQAGTYTIDSAYNTVCAGNPSGMAVATYWPNPQPYLGEDITTCQGRIVVLDAGPGYLSYKWNTDEITQTIEVSDPGYYEVEVTDNNGCKGKDGININFVAAPQTLLIKHN